MKAILIILFEIALISVIYIDTSIKDMPNEYTNLICNTSLIEVKYKCHNVGTCLAKRIRLQYNNISSEYHNDGNYVEFPSTFECAIHKDHPNRLVLYHHYEYISVLQQKIFRFIGLNFEFYILLVLFT